MRQLTSSVSQLSFVCFRCVLTAFSGSFRGRPRFFGVRLDNGARVPPLGTGPLFFACRFGPDVDVEVPAPFKSK